MSDTPVLTTPNMIDLLLARMEALEAYRAEQTATIAAQQARIVELEQQRLAQGRPTRQTGSRRGLSRGQFFRAAAIAAGAVVANALAGPETAQAGSAT
jgi:hypothetical protein